MESRPIAGRSSRWPGVVLVGVVVLCLATGFYLLEQQREQKQLLRSVQLSESIDGEVISAKILTDVMSPRQVEYLRQHPTLQMLDLNGTRFLVGRLSSLRDLPQLTALDLSRTHWLDESAMNDLADLPNLARLMLTSTDISDPLLSQLAGHPGLKVLMLTGCRRISDASIETLISLPSLELVILTDTQVTLEGFKRLRSARTDLTLFYVPDDVPGPRVTDVSLSKMSDGPSADDDGLLRLHSSASTAELTALLSIPHDWATGRWAPDGVLENFRSVTLSGPSAAASMAWMAPRLSLLRALDVPGSALMELSPQQLTNVRTATLRKIQSAEPLRRIALMTALDSLSVDVTGPGIDDVEPPPGERLPLRHLKLSGTGVNDAVVRLLSQIAAPSSVESLELDLAGPLSPATLESPGLWQSVRTLVLRGPGIDEAIVRTLGQSRDLSSLDLSLGAPLSPDALQPLSGLPELVSISLSGPGVDDPLVTSLAQFPELMWVTLQRAPVTSASVGLLLERPNPPRILVHQTQVSSSMIKRLENTLDRN